MDVSERLFAKLWNALTKKSVEPSSAAVRFEDIAVRLTLFARALLGWQVFLKASADHGGWSGATIYLPRISDRYASEELNLVFYQFRVLFLSIAWQRRLLDGCVDEQCGAVIADQVMACLRQDYPSFWQELQPILAQEADQDQKDNFWLWGQKLPFKRALAPFAPSDDEKADDGEKAEKNTITSEGTINSESEPEILNPDTKAIADYTLMHTFEKCVTAEEFNGNWREFDGEDELEDHQEALEEIKFGHLVRSNESVGSLLKSNIRMGFMANEVKEQEEQHKGVMLDEWDFRKKKLKKDHCRLFLKNTLQPSLGSARTILAAEKKLYQEIKSKIQLRFNEREAVRRVISGEELDLEAMVANHAEKHAGNSLDERIYITKRRRKLDLSVSILMDMSLSTEAFSHDVQILAIEKKALIVLGELFSEFEVEFAISGFYSETRNNCSWCPIKSFTQSWEERKDYVASVEATGYTRIGPAIRYGAQQLLHQAPSRNRWLIILTDGKPTDFDIYEGRYGIADVRHAVSHAARDGVRVVTIALDAEARSYLPLMMAGEPFLALDHPSELATALADLYGHFIAKL